MITEKQYENAVKKHDAAEKIMITYHKEQQEVFNQKMRRGHIFTDDELIYSATQLCPCGHGLAYPKDCGIDHYWDCSAILKGIENPLIPHTAQFPFAFYSIKGESENNGTTRGVFRPKGTTMTTETEKK